VSLDFGRQKRTRRKMSVSLMLCFSSSSRFAGAVFAFCFLCASISSRRGEHCFDQIAREALDSEQKSSVSFGNKFTLHDYFSMRVSLERAACGEKHVAGRRIEGRFYEIEIKMNDI
jgi:hypothetical protein